MNQKEKHTKPWCSHLPGWYYLTLASRLLARFKDFSATKAPNL